MRSKESPLKPVDEENEVRHPQRDKLDALYWAMVDEGILAMPEDFASTRK